MRNESDMFFRRHEILVMNRLDHVDININADK